MFLQIISKKTQSPNVLNGKIFAGQLTDILVSLLDYSADSECKNLCVTIMKTFVRKYTHARVGAFISGKVQQEKEKKGKRTLGGASLRDTLYTVTGPSSKSSTSRSKKDPTGSVGAGSKRGRGRPKKSTK